MRILKKLAYVCCSITLGLMALSSCEGGELYDVNAPDWISEKVDSIADSKKDPEEEILEGMQEDVYSFGNTDYTSGFWTAFSKYYVVPDGQKWHGVFNLNINPADNTYYKNFALVITNDADRGGEGYAEYGAYRFDTTNDSVAYNSQWGSHLFFKFTSSTLMLSPVDNIDEAVQKLGGKVTLTVDRTSESGFSIKIRNASATKTYEQPYKLPNLNADASNTNIRCFLVPEVSYINFLQSNIVPIGGLTSAEDKNPLSMVLQNVPDQVNVGTTLEEAVAGITAIVTFEEGVTKTVTAEELQFTAIPNIEELGTKTLVAIYNKTFKGENCDQPVVANATFEVVEKIVSIQVTAQPTHTQYYYYASAATEAMVDRTMSFNPAGLEVTATYADGSTRVIDNAKLTFSAIAAKAGTQTVTITADEATATVAVKVAESTVSAVSNSTGIVGAEDNTTGWWTVFSDDFNVPAGETKSISFTNYSSMANNWSNFAVILRKADLAEYAVVRADNFGWGAGYDGNTGLINNGTQGDWATWLADMNRAKVTVYVTNCGNGTADIQAVMEGTSGATYAQYYLGINNVDMNDLNFALTIEGGHLVF
ncbi:MAG: bacterial Ig-like domain-containing protein [Bacteroides sp.]|nr:bacterial Ig-like domain-containing protein [Bacteroides sp.]